MNNFLIDSELAMQNNINYMLLEIETPGALTNEFIVNTRPCFEEKIKYIFETYDEGMRHKRAKGTKIVGYTYTNEIATIADKISISNIKVAEEVH